jgi:hypothetical protein
MGQGWSAAVAEINADAKILEMRIWFYLDHEHTIANQLLGRDWNWMMWR